MLDDLLDAAHDAGWTVTWNPTAPPVTAYRVVLHRRGQLPTARFGVTLDEAAASILASLRTPPIPHDDEEGDA